MNIKEIYKLKLQKDIVTATLSKADECVYLTTAGNIIRYNFITKKEQKLFSLTSYTTYSDGGFDIKSPTTIYTLDDIVVVVNDYKTHGYIHYPNKYKKLHLYREDYHADISKYSIALFKDEFNVPFIIYAVAWNHLQIMNLNTRQIVTADKSLIKEFAEEDHLKFYKEYTEDNKLPWPSKYDYFFGELHMSPNKKSFLSTGWFWGSYDAINSYNLEHFMTNHRVKDLHIDSWEHCNRKACWINNNTIAITYHPLSEDLDEEIPKDAPCELHIYKIEDNKSILEKKIKVKNLDLTSQITYEKNLDAIIAFSDKIGLSIFSLNGKNKMYKQKLHPNNYYTKENLLLFVNKNTITISKILKK